MVPKNKLDEEQKGAGTLDERYKTNWQKNNNTEHHLKTQGVKETQVDTVGKDSSTQHTWKGNKDTWNKREKLCGSK